MKRRDQHIRRQQGFTLIEVLVGLALLSLLSIGLLTTVRVAQRVDRQTADLESAVQDIAATHQFLRRAIAEAYPVQTDPGSSAEAGLEGDSRLVRLLTRWSRGAGDNGMQRLLVRWESTEEGPGALVAYATHDLEGDPLSSPATVREVLLENVESMEFSYRGLGATDEWRSEWQEAMPPRLVRLRIRFAGLDAPGWPELVVATNLTNDANCEFDVVAQGCRGQVHRWLP